MSAPTLPVIDFGPYLAKDSTPEQKKETALAIDKACREVGFFYLKNHGVPLELMNEMLDKAREFFETATPEEKAKISLKKKDAGGDNARGYLVVKNEEKGSHEAVDFYRPVDASGPPFTTGMGENQWPLTPQGFKSTAEEYIEKVESLGKSVMKAMALAMDVDDTIFSERVDKAFWNLRILGYEGRKSKTPAQAGIGEHTDFGILTFLLTDPSKESLQVLSKTGEWIYADPIPGCYVCNLGDMLAEWTRGAYKSTLHRVLHNSDSLRISIPFFFDPNWDAYIAPVLPATGADDSQYQGIRYKDKFIQSIERPLWRDPLVAASEA